MRLLLDTHAAIWAVSESGRLKAATRALIKDAENQVLVSAASVWEASIKRAIGKLRLPGSITEALTRHSFVTLPVTAAHAERAGDLPLHHRDPFDRMLIAQALEEGLTIVTRDPAFAPYGVPILPA